MTIKKASAWFFLVVAGLSFAFAALGKFSGQPMMKAEFAMFGLPLGFMYVVATVELVGAVLLFTRYRFSGALLLGIVAVGAVFEHLSHGQFGYVVPPLVLGLFAWLGVYLLEGFKKSLSPARAA